MPLPDRLAAVQLLSRQVRGQLQPVQMVVIEYPNLHRSYGGQLERTWLWYDLVTCLQRQYVAVVTATVSQRARFLFGRGTATKGQVVDAVARRWPEYDTGGDDNMADAVAYLQMGRAWLGHNTGIPQANLRVLQDIDWPADRLSDWMEGT
jgi:crossover junction endodeoxyribonuclease RuvC